MIGYIFAVISAAAVALQNRFIKKLTSEPISFHPDLTNFIRFSLAPLILAILIPIFGNWSLPPWQFWLLFIGITLPAEISVAFFVARALKNADQSLVGPLYSLTPIFLLLTGWLFLNEAPSKLGILGVVLSVVGGLGLGWEISNPGMKRAIFNTFQKRQSWYMILAALLATVTITAAKYLFRYVSPLELAFYATLGLFLYHAAKIRKESLNQLKGRWFDAFRLTGFYTLSMATHYVGLSISFVAYFTTVKRISIIFDVLSGGILGKEGHMLERLIGSIVIVTGIVLIFLG